ncbi:NUDIX hydrolase [Streptomyces chiangmaiensis]|uniref:NUDIX hydrolase n=1 Tax=Streptomyces chiangmaiensis TaxID=766497 RepID=A0ABU7FVE1_9ACTN|nr:NUDIX hydrolase [Streptomyces chiangmaiensis]MED7827842.1 NUDIX hydrolase [Streptomyces chiangmaiensis]
MTSTDVVLGTYNVETGESPLQAASREVQEELGLTLTLGRLLAVDWAPNATEGDKVLYLFDGGELAPETVDGIRPQAEELKAVRFVAPHEITDRTIPRLARRILAAIEARAESAPVYLEHGQTPGNLAA